MATNQGGNNQGSKQQGDTSNRGFASMDPEKQREIASEGGKAAHASGHAHEFTPEEARQAGKMSHSGSQQSGADTGSRGSSPGTSKQSDKESGSSGSSPGGSKQSDTERGKTGGSQGGSSGSRSK